MNLAKDSAKRWQAAALFGVIVLASAMAYVLRSTPPQYSESADIIFSLPADQAAPNAYFRYAPSLITSEEAAIQVLMSPLSLHRMSLAGGTDEVDMQLLNRYNQEYPDYAEPLAALTAASATAAGAHRGFMLASQQVRSGLYRWQELAGVPPRSRISAMVIADTGPIARRGSLKRSLGGLALLTALAAVTLRNFLGRRLARRVTGAAVPPGPPGR
jgi:hypothetical protein